MTGLQRTGRRDFLSLLTIGVAAVLAGCASDGPAGTARRRTFPAPVPGPVHSLSKVPGHSRNIVLTIDDGADAQTLAAYVELARTTGLHLTFNPNGMRASAWDPQAAALAPLIDAGQVQIANHTFHHRSLVGLPEAEARAELERNEDWIQTTFATSSRPYFRPPNGTVDHESNALCGKLGYTSILLWNASFEDSQVVSAASLLASATKALEPSALIVGHANAPTVTQLYPQILELIKARDLHPVTLDEAFGTSRRAG
jgi:peptidoglycan/xylan/chitin deacetylase (PgdA/CDA1 family)